MFSYMTNEEIIKIVKDRKEILAINQENLSRTFRGRNRNIETVRKRQREYYFEEPAKNCRYPWDSKSRLELKIYR